MKTISAQQHHIANGVVLIDNLEESSVFGFWVVTSIQKKNELVDRVTVSRVGLTTYPLGQTAPAKFCNGFSVCIQHRELTADKLFETFSTVLDEINLQPVTVRLGQ